MKEASALIGIASTVGFELRVSFRSSKFKDMKINNPDSRGIVYMVIHGVRLRDIEKVEKFLEPVHIERNKRNKKQKSSFKRFS